MICIIALRHNFGGQPVTVKGKVKFFNETKGFPAANAVLGTTYGSPGGGNFSMPDLRGRFLFNLDAGGSNRLSNVLSSTTLGATGGAQQVGITQANLPNVNFAVSGITLSNVVGSATSNITTSDSLNGGATAVQLNTVAGTGFNMQTNTNFDVTSNVTVSSQGSAASGGSGSALGIVPPAMGINCMMRIA